MALGHLHLTLLVCLFLPASASASAAGVIGEVPVRVYDSTGLEAAPRRHALDTARAVLGRAGVTVAWQACDRLRPAPACTFDIRRGELVLRIVAGDGTAAAGAAALRSPVSRLTLGEAFVDRATGSGVLATIYVDRVAALSEVAASDAATLLGYAIAHEIGHLLLGTTAHGTSGLMRPVWSRDEIRRGRPVDWMFTEREVEAIRSRLDARR